MAGNVVIPTKAGKQKTASKFLARVFFFFFYEKAIVPLRNLKAAASHTLGTTALMD